MKVILPLIIGAVVVGGLIYFSSDRTANNQTTPNNSTSQTTQPAEPSTAQTQTTGAYVDYSANIIASTKGTKILFFHAPWCPQCRALETSIKSSQIPSGVTIIKVDYDTNQALRQKYGVTIQTTLVKVDDSGNLVKKYVAYDEPTFASLKSNLL